MHADARLSRVKPQERTSAPTGSESQMGTLHPTLPTPDVSTSEVRTSEWPFAVPDERSQVHALQTVSGNGLDLSDPDFRRLSAGMLFLSLFHGFRRPDDGLEHFLGWYGASLECYDLEISQTHNLADQGVWDQILADIQARKYNGLGGGPPCSTFSATRNANDGGPRPLRGEFPPELFGLADLTPDELTEVRLGTLLASRMAEACEAAYDLGDPMWAETPAQRDGKPSVFKLPRFVTLRGKEGVSTETKVQCHDGAPTSKPTDLITFLFTIAMAAECTHEPRWWRQPWSGKWKWGAHPPLRGKEWMIPAEEWRPRMKRWGPPGGPYLSRNAAAYPAGMNQAIAEAWLGAAVAVRMRKSQTQSMVTTGRWSNAMRRQEGVDDTQTTLPPGKRQRAQVQQPEERPMVQYKVPLRQQPDKRVPALFDEKACVCGLVNTWECMDKLPGHKVIGPALTKIIDAYLDQNPKLEADVFDAIGKDQPAADEHGRPQESIAAQLSRRIEPLRERVARGLATRGTPPSGAKVANRECSTEIRAHLLEAWARHARDPGQRLCKWLTEGAPAGLACTFEDLDGLYPRVDPAAETGSPDDLFTDHDSFVNYKGVDEDPDAAKVIDSYIASGYMQEFQRHSEVAEFVGGEPIVSKLGLVVKERVNPTSGKVTKKVRIILDNKQSGVSTTAVRTHRSTLPRAIHAIGGALSLMNWVPQPRGAHRPNVWTRQCPSHSPRRLRWLIADFTDAFWTIPLHPKERRFFVTRHRDRWLVFLRTAQGSKGAPLTWASIAALVARCLQSLFFTDCTATVLEAKLQLYVDDPLLSAVGDDKRTRRLCVRFCVACLILGLELAFNKAQYSDTVVWIGVGLHVAERRVEATIPLAKITELLSIISEMLGVNVVTVKALRSFAGKAMNIASLLVVWRPFLAPCWAALSQTQSNAPLNTVWVKQFRLTLLWLQEFLEGRSGAIVRVFDVETFFNHGDRLQITADASIYGLGAWLTVNGVITSWFAVAVEPLDMQVLQRQFHHHESQQACEALCLLVALRLWSTEIKRLRATLSVRSDNVGALAVVASLKGSGEALGLVARELALDLGECEYFPKVVEHIPGVANDTADSLSRRFDPSKQPWSAPFLLKNVPEAQVPPRPYSWWRVYCREYDFNRHANTDHWG